MSYIGRTPTNAALTASDLADGIVGTAKIAADAVTDAKIADDVVGTEHLTANEVDTAALGADAVTSAELADDAVDSEHYTDGSIDTAHLADGQVTIGKLATAVLTGATDIGAAIVDADLFLIDDGAGGTLRKTAASRIKTYIGGGVNTPCFEVSLGSDQDIDNSETSTKITFDTEAIDSDGKFASNRFTPTVAGTYFISLTVAIENGTQGETDLVIATIKKNGSTVTASDARIDFRGNRARGGSVTANALVVFDSNDYVEGFAAHAAGGGTTKIKTFGSRMGGFKLIT